MTFDEGWMHGNLLSNKTIAIIALLVFAVGGGIMGYETYSQSTKHTVVNVYGNSEIMLNCGVEQCQNITVIQIVNDQTALTVSVSTTWQCTCQANVVLNYNSAVANVTSYNNGVANSPILKPGQNVTLLAQAQRSSGMGDVYLNVQTTPA